MTVPDWFTAAQAVATVLLTIITFFYVRESRRLVNANIEPELSMEIGPDPTVDRSTAYAVLRDVGAPSIVEVEVRPTVVHIFRPLEGLPTSFRPQVFGQRLATIDGPSRMKTGETFRFNYWLLAKEALSRKDTISAPEGYRVDYTGLEFHVRYRHAVTRRLHYFNDFYEARMESNGDIVMLRKATSAPDPDDRLIMRAKQSG